MKFKPFSLSLFSISTLLTLAPTSTPAAFAGCVMTDVATQVAIHGSKNPAKQTNNVDMGSQRGCLGNTTTSTATQLYVGPGDVEQTRDSSHFVGGGTDDRTKVGGPAIGFPVHVPVDVYSPAHDPDFLSGLKPSKSRIH
jgi:hypothetical protein